MPGLLWPSLADVLQDIAIPVFIHVNALMCAQSGSRVCLFMHVLVLVHACAQSDSSLCSMVG